MVKVLVIARTPPPHLGAPIMLEHLVRSQMQGVKLHHLPIGLSTDDGHAGKFRWMKLVRLFLFIVRIVYTRIVLRPHILYYAPELVRPRTTILRDAAILSATRFAFSKTVFHLHSSGYDELNDNLPRWQRWLLRRGLFHPDGVIRLSNLTPDDGKHLHARREYIVPNGIVDPFPKPSRRGMSVLSESKPIRVLFAGMLCEAKGLVILVEACGELAARDVPFHLDLMGPFESDEFKDRLQSRVTELRIEDRVSFLGVLTGEEKFAVFEASDVLCHPTHGRDTLPIVILEAMAASLPVVSTYYSGIPSIVVDEETGFLVEPRDVNAVAERLALLAQDAGLRERMGSAGREKFLREFTLSRHIERMRTMFLDVAGVSNADERTPVAKPVLAH